MQKKNGDTMTLMSIAWIPYLEWAPSHSSKKGVGRP